MIYGFVAAMILLVYLSMLVPMYQMMNQMWKEEADEWERIYTCWNVNRALYYFDFAFNYDTERHET